MHSRLLALALITITFPAFAQTWPDGPGQEQVVATCGGCHDLNRLRIGYTPEGWLTVTRMMQNFDTPIAAEDWPAVTAYLMKHFPERDRPNDERRGLRAGVSAAADDERDEEGEHHGPLDLLLEVAHGRCREHLPEKERRQPPRSLADHLNE